MKGINEIKHQRLLHLMIEMQYKLASDGEGVLINKLQAEGENLQALYLRYLKLLDEVGTVVKDYELKERQVRSGLLSKRIRMLSKRGGNDSPIASWISTINSCAR
ncbi:hypothetical protein [Sphingobacterium sp.]|uniref:hypothetical protein n=1 Tax=Sphingobacterium sp. TaxID=341027 RepID=UPI00289C1B2A|nr:hypothetical protein [Sphingobacterium sp.]